MKPVDDSNLGQAIDLVMAGIHNRTRQFWEAGLERIHAHAENREQGVPLGYFLTADSKAVGVIFTIAATQWLTDGRAQKVINLSTWYIEPEHRWRAPMMMQRIVRDSAFSYTSLTPTGAVQKILTALGFAAVNDGVSLIPLPAAALRAGWGTRVVDLDGVPAGGIPEPLRATLATHSRLGCIALAFEHEGRWHPVVVKHRSLKGVPALRVIYADRYLALPSNLGAVSRFLLRTGRPVLIMDKPVSGTAPGFAFGNHGRAYRKGPFDDGCSDHTGSELVYFDF